MYDADWEDYEREQRKEAVEKMVSHDPSAADLFDENYYPSPARPAYQLRHGDEMSVHSDGVRRDTTKGKVKYTLMFPRGVPREKQLIYRVAQLYTTGGARYGDRNWENSQGEDTLDHHLEALWRHFMTFFFDDDPTEDHAAAIVWNINAVELTRRHIAEREQDEKEAVAHKAEAEAAWPDVFPDNLMPGEEVAVPVQSPELTQKMKLFNQLCGAFDWEDGDCLTEITPSADKAGTWTYSKGGDVWYFQGALSRLSDGRNLSARSLRNLVQEFGPFRVTKGSYQGLILYPDGNAKYDY